jgi:hypothetical protein
MKNKIFLLFVFIALLSGCASGTPAWIASGKHDSYPTTLFLTATGTGTSAEAARDQATGRVSQLLEVSLTDELLNASRLTRNGIPADRLVNEARAAALVKARHGEVMAGIRIVETWQDPESNTWHAFAAMARSDLRSAMTKLDNDTDSYLAQARRTPEMARKIRAVSTALDSQVARSAFEQALKAVDPNYRPGASPHSIVQLAQQLDEHLQRAPIEIVAENDTAGTLLAMGNKAVAASGFTVGAGEQAVFRLEMRFPLEDLGYQDRWYWSRGVLSLTLKDAKVAREHGSYQWAIKAAGRSGEDAAQRVTKQAEVVLGKELRGILIRLATN